MSEQELPGKTPNENINQVFDFTSRLASGETISSATTVAATYSGTDESPENLVAGASSISGARVTQKIIGGNLGVTYLLLCTAITSLGQTLQISAYLSIVPTSI